MDEVVQTHIPSGDDAAAPLGNRSPPRAPGAERAASREREARADSAARLLEAVAEYERTVSLLLAAVVRLCLPGREHGMGDADGSHANRAEERNRPNG